MNDLRIGNTMVLAAALGIKENVVSSQAGSSALSHSMSSSALHDLQDTLTDRVDEKLSSLKKSIGAIVEGPEKGISILNVLRQSKAPVMMLLDELRNMPNSNTNPISFLKEQGFPENLLEKLGLHEGMSKSECQEILGQHFQEILRGVGVSSGVRNLCKLAIRGEDYYRNLSSKLKVASTITGGVANIITKPIFWIARGVAKASGKDAGQWSEENIMKSVATVTSFVVTTCVSLCPPLAIAAGVMFGVFLLSKGVSALLELINEAFVKTCLEGKEDAWDRFFFNLFRKIAETVGDVMPSAMVIAGIGISGEAGQVLRAAGQGGSARMPEGGATLGSPAVPMDTMPPDVPRSLAVE
ncbi:MAG: hypothetical protein LBG98_01335 [Puniceicoccales bacterium]|jgi:hypothetical protein|nr:hypothetical protein [Puniceicoccales bacterium]